MSQNGRRYYGSGSRSNSNRRAALWSFLFGSTSSPGVCFWCERHLYFDRSTFDHVPPLSKGGEVKRGVISCYTCNHERRNKYDPVRDRVPDYLTAMREEYGRETIGDNRRRMEKIWERVVDYLSPSSISPISSSMSPSTSSW